MILRIISFIIIYFIIAGSYLLATDIEIKDRQLYVNGKPFVIKGVCYEAIPPGKTTDYEWEAEKDAVASDFKMLREMGANCIRTYYAPKYDYVMDKAYENGLYIIIEIPVAWNTNYSVPSVKNKILDDVEEAVTRWKDHPAVLMWCVGHEVNLNIYKDSNGNLIMDSISTNRLQSWYPLLNEVAGKIHDWEAPYWHPVTHGESVDDADAFGIWLGSVDTVGNPVFYSDDENMENFDVWGVQTYQGNGFQTNFFSVYNSLSSKPLWIAETGCDVYDVLAEKKDEESQSKYINSQWDDIEENLNDDDEKKTCIGVTFFSWMDGWYKATGGQTYTHDTNAGWINDKYTNDYQLGRNNMNEEWWGIVAQFPGTVAREPRKAYYTLQSKWAAAQDGEALDSVLYRKLSVNVPNPLNITDTENTDIWVYLKLPAKITAQIYDYTGKLIIELTDPVEYAGYTYNFKWNAKDKNEKQVKPGIYLCKISSEFEINNSSQKEIQYIKMAVIK